MTDRHSDRVSRNVNPDDCDHEWLDQRGRCVECGTWAVLTGQVPVRPRGVTSD